MLTIEKFQVAIPMFSDAKCSEKYGQMYNPSYQICGGETDANSGACQVS